MTSPHNVLSAAIVVPVYRELLTADEQVSLRHLLRFLGEHERFIVAPQSLAISIPGFGIRRFDDAFFTGTASYSRLLLSHQFYEAFSGYEYILIYQLDALVFSDQLAEWCAAGYDYIGAPWLKDKSHPQQGFSRCGNGGFSLRRVESFLRVLGSGRYVSEPVPYVVDLLRAPLPDVRHRFRGLARLVKRARVLRQVRQGAEAYAAAYSLNEDHFWSDRARLFYPDFRIAPVDAGLRFAFERTPRYCFEQNGRQLPFGCHAWARWDRAFWEPYLLI
jgi:hypothetical protein